MSLISQNSKIVEWEFLESQTHLIILSFFVTLSMSPSPKLIFTFEKTDKFFQVWKKTKLKRSQLETLQQWWQRKTIYQVLTMVVINMTQQQLYQRKGWGPTCLSGTNYQRSKTSPKKRKTLKKFISWRSNFCVTRRVFLTRWKTPSKT